MSFGENLQFYRAAEGLTQEQLAERLEVSRQSVSKWESDSSFPEMEKLLVMCDMFRCDLDTLLRGDAQASRQTDTAGYDAHMDKFTRQITAGVVLCICGTAAAALAEGLDSSGRWSGAVFLMFVLAAAMLFITGGLQHHNFCERYPSIEPFYAPETLAEWQQRFPGFIASGVALCIGGMILMTMLDGVGIGSLNPAQCEGITTAAGLLAITCGVGLLTFGGMQNGKFHVESYNRECELKHDIRSKRLGQIQGAIMLAATALFLLYFFFWKTQEWSNQGIGFGAAAIFGIGGIICAIVGTRFHKDGE